MTDANLRTAAESFLANDARVASFALTEEEGRLLASVAPAVAWLRSERAAAYEAISGRMLRQWQMVYDRSYRRDATVRAPNFDAWISRITDAPIPVERMQVWLGDALAQLRSVPHARVLDVGCGVGLVLADLAQGGTAYDGLDFSEEALASLGAWVATQDTLRHVRLIQGSAHDIDTLDVGGTESFEVAVLNSVVQYFPDADYLVRVLRAVAGKIATGGAIFLGDLRATALLPMLAACVAAAHAPRGATVGEVREQMRAAQGMARELAIDPSFLGGLGTSLPRLADVRFSLKPATADRELACYRYDAMLLLDAPTGVVAPRVEVATMDDIVGRIDKGADAFAIMGLANARLARDVVLARELATAADDMSFATLLAVVDATKPDGFEPDAIAAAAAARGYAAEMRFTPGSPEGRFDVLIRKGDRKAQWPQTAVAAYPTNDPLGAELMGKLRRGLQGSLDKAVGAPGFVRLDLAEPPAGGIGE